MDLLKSWANLKNVLAMPHNRVALALNKAREAGLSLSSIIFAINFYFKFNDENYNCVLYFVAEEPIPDGSLLERFVNGSDEFRRERLKIICHNKDKSGKLISERIILLGSKCEYHRGERYLEIDVDIESLSIFYKPFVYSVIGCSKDSIIDLAFLIEATSGGGAPGEAPWRHPALPGGDVLSSRRGRSSMSLPIQSRQVAPAMSLEDMSV
ncbi:hypothetical protein SAY86_007987 [Trapa natans]|uniref:Protein ENHANCED DISEASE RESISTANCE 2 C-terminal domain-containing protein n=1 Tax=Trapa natans TaxID=22666 RepID=A0AAN7L9A8_TRANT|nr:hypothetical protein SAY86_007987 [Trapa natans]